MKKKDKAFRIADLPPVEKLVAAPVMRLVTEGGKSLELITWRDEPAVIVDGKFILRHSALVRHLGNMVRKEEKTHE